jgi:hypothetical protein
MSVMYEGVPSRECQACRTFHPVEEFHKDNKTCSWRLSRKKLRYRIEADDARLKVGYVPKKRGRPPASSREPHACGTDPDATTGGEGGGGGEEGLRRPSQKKKRGRPTNESKRLEAAAIEAAAAARAGLARAGLAQGPKTPDIAALLRMSDQATAYDAAAAARAAEAGQRANLNLPAAGTGGRAGRVGRRRRRRPPPPPPPPPVRGAESSPAEVSPAHLPG